jgi:Asp/Glu/hydantoin racemase
VLGWAGMTDLARDLEKKAGVPALDGGLRDQPARASSGSG